MKFEVVIKYSLEGDIVDPCHAEVEIKKAEGCADKFIHDEGIKRGVYNPIGKSENYSSVLHFNRETWKALDDSIDAVVFSKVRDHFKKLKDLGEVPAEKTVVIDESNLSSNMWA
jgi:hypothetical protein